MDDQVECPECGFLVIAEQGEGDGSYLMCPECECWSAPEDFIEWG